MSMFGRIKPKHPITEKNGVKYKICSKCGQELTLDNFSRRSPYDPRRLATCKDCTKEIRNANRKKRIAKLAIIILLASAFTIKVNADSRQDFVEEMTNNYPTYSIPEEVNQCAPVIIIDNCEYVLK